MIPAGERSTSQQPSLEAELIARFRSEMQVEVSSADTDLIDEGILDSLTFVELLFHLETHYHVKVEIESIDTDDFRTVARIANIIRRERAA